MVLSPHIDSIVFDLDGTLYTCQKLADRIFELAVQRVAESRGIDLVEAKKLVVGAQERIADLQECPATLTQTCQELGIPPKELHQILQNDLHPELYLDHDPVLLALLESLAEICNLYIYTNNNLPTARKILALLGVDHLFSRLFTIEMNWSPKPDPEGLTEVLQQIGGPSDSFLFVGDRHAVDLEPAEALGIDTLLVDDVSDLLQIHQYLGLIP